MPDTPLISVVVPVYNTQAYLRTCIQSILAQTHANLEVILVDDQSCDNSWGIMQACAKQDRRIKIFQKPTNTGPSDTRNWGIERMSGDYLAFVDGDDFIEPTMMEKMLAKAAAEDADIVLCSYSRFETQGQYIKPRADIAPAMESLAAHPRGGQELYPIFFHLGTTVWRGLFRTQLINKYKEPFPAGLCYEDDYWHTFYRLRARKVAAVNEPLYHYRTRGGSISTSQNFSSDVLEIFKRFESANADYLKDPALEQNYTAHKAQSILQKLPRMLSFKDRQRDMKTIAELQASLRMIEAPPTGLSPRQKSLFNFIKSASPAGLYWYLKLLHMRKSVSSALKSLLKFNVGKSQERYIKLAGHTLRLTPPA